MQLLARQQRLEVDGGGGTECSKTTVDVCNFVNPNFHLQHGILTISECCN